MTRSKAQLWTSPVVPHGGTNSYFIMRAFVGDKKAGEMELRLLGDKARDRWAHLSGHVSSPRLTCERLVTFLEFPKGALAKNFEVS